MNISEKIKYIRKELINISQENFATKVGVSTGTIKKWESGTSKPTVNHLLMISLISNVTLQYLIFDDYPEEISTIKLTDDDYIIIKSMIEHFKKKNKELKSNEK